MMLRLLVMILTSLAALAAQAELKTMQPGTSVQVQPCREGSTRCYQNQFLQCHKGRWTVSQTCSRAQRCDTQKGCVSPTVQGSPARPGPTMMTVPPVAQPQADLGRHLNCPTVPSNPIVLPPPPYDEAAGDCALRGKSAQIEAWLSDLERIASDCQARGERYWNDTRNSYASLGRQIGSLTVAATRPPGDRVVASEAACPMYPGGHEPGSPSERIPPESAHYTTWLKRIGENVVDYCEKVDKLIEPMYSACDEINFYLDCQRTTEGRKASYRMLLDSRWNAAQLRYNSSRTFYTNTLQRYGWGNFRSNFNEEYLRCGPDTSRRTVPQRMIQPSR